MTTRSRTTNLVSVLATAIASALAPIIDPTLTSGQVRERSQVKYQAQRSGANTAKRSGAKRSEAKRSEAKRSAPNTTRSRKGSARSTAKGKRAEPNGFVKWLRETAPQRKARQASNKQLAAQLRAQGVTNFKAEVTTPEGTMTVWQAAKAGHPVA